MATLDKTKITREREVENILMDMINDRDWCRENRVNYTNPNIEEARKKLYKQLNEMRYFQRKQLSQIDA